MRFNKSIDLFKNRNFLKYWLSYLFSALGDSIYYFLIPWMIKEITGSGTMMGTFLLVVGVPRIMFMLFGGVIVDRFDGRKVMMLSDMLRAILMIVMLVLLMLNSMNMSFIFILGFIFGTVDAFYWPAVTSIQQRVIEKNKYVQSNSVFAGTWQITALIGPIIGAFLYQLDNGKTCFIFICISFVISAITLFLIKLMPIKTAIQTEKKSNLKENFIFGIRFILQNRLVLTLIITMLFANASFRMLFVGLPFLAKSFGASESEFGMMQSMLGGGGIIVSLLFAFVFIIKNPSLKVNMIAVSAQGVGLLLLGFTSNVWQAMIAIGFIGIATALVSTFIPSVFQKVIPMEVMGRVSSVNMMVAQGVVPLAQAFGGWVIDISSPNILFIAAGLVEMLTGLIALMLPTSVVLYEGNKKQSV
ncbi:MFS transporter [Gottfriedia acidiceleris]|uniref:MFS transporter n=1 Tax=Gottfriedia acidiceleris TaxID=371036 RepID=UPI000B43EEE4|nr:MFS transporter [Gottfriedia acidiceleris]